MFFDGFVEGFDRFFESPDVGDGNGDDLIDGVIEGFGEVVGDFGGRLDSLGDGGRVREMITSFIGDESGEFVDVHIGKLIDGFELFEQSHRSSAGLVGKNFFLGEAGELHGKIVSEPLLLAGEVLNGEKTCAGKVLQSFVSVVVHIYLLRDSAEAQIIGNNERIYGVIFRQVRV